MSEFTAMAAEKAVFCHDCKVATTDYSRVEVIKRSPTNKVSFHPTDPARNNKRVYQTTREIRFCCRRCSQLDKYKHCVSSTQYAAAAPGPVSQYRTHRR